MLQKISIQRLKPSPEHLRTYARSFRERCPDWSNFLGEPVYMALMDGDDPMWRDYPPFSPYAEETRSGDLLRQLENAREAELIDILRRHRAIPDSFYVFSGLESGVSHAEPIYTGVTEISLEGGGSIVAEAFLGAEAHVLDVSGRVIHRSVMNRHFPRLGLGDTVFIDLNSEYDTQVKGRYDERNVAMTDYHMQPLTDFTVQCNTFPFLEGRDEWCLHPDRTNRKRRMTEHLDNWRKEGYLEEVLRRRPLDFPILPPEVRSDPEWAERFSALHPVNFLSVSEALRNDKDFVIRLISHRRRVVHPSTGLARDLADPIKVYPYLPRHLRRDMDILRAMQAAGLLFDLPWPNDCTPEQCDDVRDFMDLHADRILQVVGLFPHILHFGPEVLERMPKAYADDNDIMLNLVAAHREALPRASPRLRQDREFLLQCVRNNPGCLELVPEPARSDTFLMQELQQAARAAEDELPF